MDSQPAPTPQDTKDWTVVITQGCPQCGFEPFAPPATGERLAAAAEGWHAPLARPDAGERPAAEVWSPLEYGCHVRDVLRLLERRVRAMLDGEDPEFADWDGGETAVQDRYWAADPRQTDREITQATESVRELLDGLDAEQWERSGHRSDGVPFTVGTLCLYFTHEAEHHLRDATGS